ncbi:MAG: NADH-quinone oxidoreductase subunit NuoE [Bacteroidota bacterium]|nr:NADH-quinone oxidoreductase subunit NuoE [Bacteroidota bacterium]
MVELFTPAELEEVERIKSLYPEPQAALLPVLWMVQQKYGWISLENIRAVAELLRLPYAHVLGVVRFYTMFHTEPVGRYHIQVCTNVSCMLRGGERVLEYISQKLGIQHKERTADGLFSLEEVECMGACGGAPMIAINEDYYENITLEQIDHLLEHLRRESAAESRNGHESTPNGGSDELAS